MKTWHYFIDLETWHDKAGRTDEKLMKTDRLNTQEVNEHNDATGDRNATGIITGRRHEKHHKLKMLVDMTTNHDGT